MIGLFGWVTSPFDGSWRLQSTIHHFFTYHQIRLLLSLVLILFIPPILSVAHDLRWQKPRLHVVLWGHVLGETLWGGWRWTPVIWHVIVVRCEHVDTWWLLLGHRNHIVNLEFHLSKVLLLLYWVNLLCLNVHWELAWVVIQCLAEPCSACITLNHHRWSRCLTTLIIIVSYLYLATRWLQIIFIRSQSQKFQVTIWTKSFDNDATSFVDIPRRNWDTSSLTWLN